MSIELSQVATTSGATLGLRSGVARELNAVFAIAWREVLRAVKSPISIAVTLICPVIFLGILGGSLPCGP